MKEKITKFDINDAFKALDELEYPSYSSKKPLITESLVEKVDGRNGFDKLFEEVYDAYDQEDLAAAKQDRASDVAAAKLQRIEEIVDLDADAVEDLLGSYVGKTVIQCPQCKTMFYKKSEDVVPSEDNPDLVNVSEVCQHCGNSSGYEIIGKIAEAKPEETQPAPAPEATEEVPAEEAPTEENLGTAEEASINVGEPEEVPAEESFNRHTGSMLTEAESTTGKSITNKYFDSLYTVKYANDPRSSFFVGTKEECQDWLKEHPEDSASKAHGGFIISKGGEVPVAESTTGKSLLSQIEEALRQNENLSNTDIKSMLNKKLTEAAESDLDKELAAHNEYIDYIQGQIELQTKALENAKKTGNQEVIDAIQRIIDTYNEDLKAALPEAVKNKIEAEDTDLPTAEEAGVDEGTEEVEEPVQESLHESKRSLARKAAKQINEGKSTEQELEEGAADRWKGFGNALKNGAQKFGDKIAGNFKISKQLDNKFSNGYFVRAYDSANKFWSKEEKEVTVKSFADAVKYAENKSKGGSNPDFIWYIKGQDGANADFKKGTLIRGYRKGKLINDKASEIITQTRQDARSAKTDQKADSVLKDQPPKDTAEVDNDGAGAESTNGVNTGASTANTTSNTTNTTNNSATNNNSSNTETTDTQATTGTETNTSTETTTAQNSSSSTDTPDSTEAETPTTSTETQAPTAAETPASTETPAPAASETASTGTPAATGAPKADMNKIRQNNSKILNALKTAQTTAKTPAEAKPVNDFINSINSVKASNGTKLILKNLRKALFGEALVKDVEDIDEASLNECISKYLQEVYENVDKFSLKNCKLEDNKFICEGSVNFKSNKCRNMVFEFVPTTRQDNVLVLEGYNKEFSNNKAFALKAVITEGCLKTKELKYKYSIKESVVKGHIETTINE